MSCFNRGSGRIAAAGLLVCGLLGACGAKSGVELQGEQPPRPSASDDNEKRLVDLLRERRGVSNDREYRVGSGDRIKATIHDFRPDGGNFEDELIVDERGYLSLPMLPPLHAEGQTLGELRSSLISALQEQQVMRSPLVSVSVNTYQGQRVLVLGAVGRPGVFHLTRGRETLIDVLSQVGGMTSSAGNYVILRPAGARTSGDDDLIEQYSLQPLSHDETASGQLDDAVAISIDGAGGATNPYLMNLPVRGGDLIVVPGAGKAFVEGEVAEPGIYPLHHGMTLMQLLATAGGTTFPAKRSAVRIVRTPSAGEKGQWIVDIDAIQNQEREDILLEPNDRIVVPGTAPKQVVYGIYRAAVAVVSVGVGGSIPLF